MQDAAAAGILLIVTRPSGPGHGGGRTVLLAMAQLEDVDRFGKIFPAKVRPILREAGHKASRSLRC